jgi:diketogulonate reductase-like aldo/keto reductase
LLYGNESWVGDAFKKIFDEGEFSREDVFITTKV